MSTFAATSSGGSSEEERPFKFSWQQTMLRIKDPKISVPYYCDNYGFKQIIHYDFPQWNFSLYFLAILKEGEMEGIAPGSKDAEDFLWRYQGVVLELTCDTTTAPKTMPPSK